MPLKSKKRLINPHVTIPASFRIRTKVYRVCATALSRKVMEVRLRNTEMLGQDLESLSEHFLHDLDGLIKLEKGETIRIEL